MKQNKKLLGAILVILVTSFSTFYLSCIKPLSESYSDESVGLNGGFEYIKNGLPINWLVYTSKTITNGNFSIQIDTVMVKEGKRSLYFNVVQCSSLGGHLSPGLAHEIDVKADEIYTIKMWVKNKSAGYRLSISGVDAKQKAEGITHESDEPTQDWLLINYDYTIPKKMNKLRLEFNVIKPGECWVDGVSILKK